MDKITSHARAEGRRTCQCCGRMIMANTGVIAHHGFTRPQGWQQQVGTCWGARCQPFEVSRDVLGEVIVSIAAKLDRAMKARDALQNETAPVPFRYTTRTRGFASERVARHVDVTRETFDDVREAYRDEMRTYSAYSFDTMLARELERANREIQQINVVLTEQHTRFTGWTQTERWDATANAWVVL